MKSYSATITCSRMASLDPHSFLTPKGFKFYNKTHIKCYFGKPQTHFSRDVLFIGCDIFPQVMVILFAFLVLFAFLFAFLITLENLPVSILRAKLWKFVTKC